ncbi:unnamed protein product [Amoebophrya sp. A25]|nr:unnamed protein product [Amoebophrya sp. A25]|eukprot:GSA25T00009108001.1
MLNHRLDSALDLRRLQKNYIVRCNEDLSNILQGGTGNHEEVVLIRGDPVRPCAQIARCEGMLRKMRHVLAQVMQKQLLLEMEAQGSNAKQNMRQNLRSSLQHAHARISEKIQETEKHLLRLQAR